MPKQLSAFSLEEVEEMRGQSLQEIAFKVAKQLIQDDLIDNELKKIIEEAINFDTPLVEIANNTFILELFHGPTLAFKDFGARFMARLMSHFLAEESRKVTILTATSGDTGSAVAHGFYGVENVEVIILFPKNKVSPLQEKQMTTLGGNIQAIEIDGSFDDCQKLVKDAFKNQKLVEKLGLSSANSINIGRLIPQVFYYFYSWSQLPESNLPIVYSVPSGNFGNLTAGLIAKKLGLPINKFIAATNANSVVPEYLEGGEFVPRSSVETISNAMDIGNPSNFERIKELYKDNWEQIKANIYGASFNDTKTKQQMQKIFKQKGYILDPHGAVALLGLKNFREDHGQCLGVSLETAHPAKFKEVVEGTLEINIDVPERLAKCREKESYKLEMNIEEFEEYLTNQSSKDS